MSTKILCVNAGSSTLKSARFRADGPGALHLIEATQVDAGPDAFHAMLDGTSWEPDVVAHRVVHGGAQLVEHTLIDDAVLEQLRAATPFAPLHLPSELDAIDAARRRFPNARGVACFDTTFHRTMPAVARRLALPAALDAVGVRRYGFHGLSCEYVVAALTPATIGRAVIAHLGSGASLTAIEEGRSVDTTMGLTPTGGTVMATRTGDLDPGVIIHLLRSGRYNIDELESLVNHESGLIGLSGTTGDMRALLEQRVAGDGDAALAIDVFCSNVAKRVGAFATVLRGLDTVVFTGGIGEHSAEIRAEVCARLAHLGCLVDDDRNGRHDALISVDDAPVAVRVVPTDENRVMAQHALTLGES